MMKHSTFLILLMAFTRLTAQTSITDQILVREVIDNETINITGDSELHITGNSNVLNNSTINLNSDGAWLYFDNIQASQISNYFSQVKINGQNATKNTNFRVSMYRLGSVIIPHGSDFEPLEVFDGVNFTGNSRKMATYTFYRGEATSDDVNITQPIVMLEGFDNLITSFKLKKGYMATFAQASDGSGYSKVYVADREDIEIPSLVEGLKGKVSFVRVLPWKYPSKKGYTNLSGANLLDATWFYNWGPNPVGDDDVEGVAMKWGSGNAGVTFSNQKNISHLLGVNEPSHEEQSNLTVEQVLKLWPSLQKSGQRIGSPGIADNGKPWLWEFMREADKLNLRIDYVAVHWYQGGRTARQMYNWLKEVHDRTGRPVWITEWNNGANWTNEGDPTFQEQAVDVRNFIAMMDTTSWIERYAIYNWVEQVRAVLLKSQSGKEDSLTLAGEEYKKKNSPLAYNPDKDYHMKYLGLIKPYLLEGEQDNDEVHLRWHENVSDEKGIIVQRSLNNEKFVTIATLEGEEITEFSDTTKLEAGAYRYRLSYFDDTDSSDFSDEYFVQVKLPNVINVSLQKSVNVDTQNGSSVGGLAVDGNISGNSSRWVTTNTAYPHYIEIDLKDTFDISFVSFYTGFDGYNRPLTDFQFLGWNNLLSKWDTIFLEEDNAQPVFHEGFEPYRTNKVKLNITGGEDNFVRLYELEVFGSYTDGRVTKNVVLNKPVKVSSTHSSGNWPGSLAIDGNTESTNDNRWVSQAGFPQWIEVDLQGDHLYELLQMKLYIGTFGKDGDPIKDFNLQAWNGYQWISNVTRITGNNDEIIQRAFNSVPTNKLRLYIESGADLVRLHEMEVYGFETDIPNTGNKPFAVNDQYTGHYNQIISAKVLSNDKGLIDSPFRITILQQPQNGQISINTSTNIITYRPDSLFIGRDVIKYSISDKDGDQSEAMATFDIDKPNYQPQAVDDNYEMSQGSELSLDILSNDSQLFDTPIAITLESQPNTGTVNITNDQKIKYSADPTYAGYDTLVYKIMDSDGDQAQARVIIFLDAIPTLASDSYQTTSGDSLLLDILKNDSNIGNTPISLNVLSKPNNGTILIASDSVIQYKSNEGFSGKDSIQYLVIDFDGDSAYAWVEIEVEPEMISSLVKTSKKSDILIFPNPNTGFFKIKGLDDETFIEIFDLFGKKRHSSFSSGIMNVNKLPTGVYYIIISNEIVTSFVKL